MPAPWGEELHEGGLLLDLSVEGGLSELDGSGKDASKLKGHESEQAVTEHLQTCQFLKDGISTRRLSLELKGLCFYLNHPATRIETKVCSQKLHGIG